MRHGRRILLLEDDPDDAQRCRDSLAESGYAVLVADSLAAARRAVERDAAFDLVIVDHHLQDGEGPAIIPHLRAAGIQAPVVMVTGNPSEQVAEMAFAMGCVDTAIKDLNYHGWLPRMAQTFIGGAAAREPGGKMRWGTHVLAVSVGRVHGRAFQGEPAEAWPPYSEALRSATELAILCVRAARLSALGSLPSVHVQVERGRHLALVMRGGVFAAALLSRPPDQDDHDELVAEAAAFSKARTDSGALPMGA